MEKQQLREVGEWAQTRVASGQEPPWTFHKLKLLADLALELAEGMESGVAYRPGETTAANGPVSDTNNVIEFQAQMAAEEEPYANLPA